ncbi:MAG: hypothetical protein P1V35_02460 [Planctomycetota bacterium]|nr:hypothetical protein [Planctomycetota bacterium]
MTLSLKNTWLVGLGMLALVACKGETKPVESDTETETTQAQDLPEGTVLLVEGLPITAEEVDRWLPIYSMLEPAKSEHAIRRYIITNYNLPVTVGAVADPEARARARARLQLTLDALNRGEEAPIEGPQVQRIHDTFKSEMGLDRWGMAKMNPTGEWSEVFETLGGFTAVRLVGAPDQWLPNSAITVEHITVDYIPASDSREFVTEALKAVDIQVIDPEWERYIPLLYLHNSKLPQ